VTILQLTGGQFKNIKLTTPVGTRPTLSIVREAVFNILFSYFGDFSGLHFLDGYSGSGIMALEAYSRGFDITLVEINSRIASSSAFNLKKIGLNQKIVISDYKKFIKNTNQHFDVIYIDPPWGNDYAEILLNTFDKVSSSGVLVIECDKKMQFDFLSIIPSGFELIKDKVYGRARLMFVARNS
jgi:16S rRNA (guanine966-N2)-methyltransferase